MDSKTSISLYPLFLFLVLFCYGIMSPCFYDAQKDMVLYMECEHIEICIYRLQIQLFIVHPSKFLHFHSLKFTNCIFFFTLQQS